MILGRVERPLAPYVDYILMDEVVEIWVDHKTENC